MPTFDFSRRYAPAEAERGKYVPVDNITGYVSGDNVSVSRGRYAILTYNMGGDTAAPGNSSVNPIYVNVTNPINIVQPISAEIINVAQMTVYDTVSSMCYNPIDLGGRPMITPIWVSGNTLISNTTASPIPVTFTDVTVNTVQLCSISIGANASSVISFSPEIKFLEIYNTSVKNTVYIYYDSITYSQLIAKGLPITSEAYYSIEKAIDMLVIGNPNATTTDLRIFGHYYL